MRLDARAFECCCSLRKLLSEYGGYGEIGDDIVSNGAFATDLTGWAGANWAWDAGAALHTAGSTAGLSQAATVAVIGARYEISYEISGETAGRVQLYFGGVWGPANFENKVHVDYIVATSTDGINFVPTSDFDGRIDNVVIRQVTGGDNMLGDLTVAGDLTLHGSIKIPYGHAIAIGHDALTLNRTGIYNIPASNIAIGFEAAQKTTTGHVTAVGYQAARDNTDGVITAFGKWAGRANTTGHSSFFGNAAGRSNTTSSSCIFGDEAGGENQTGEIACFGYYAGSMLLNVNGCAFGQECARYATSGSITAFGYRALYVTTTGSGTAFGNEAGRLNTIGNGIFIGRLAGVGVVSANAPVSDTEGILIGDNANRSVVSATVLTNYIGIGTGVLVDKSNQVVLGNASIVETILRGTVMTQASAAARSGLNIASGIDPAAPNSGDFWYDGTNLKFRDGAVTRTLTWV